MFVFSKWLVYLSIIIDRLAYVSRDHQLFAMVLHHFEEFFYEKAMKNHPDYCQRMQAKVVSDEISNLIRLNIFIFLEKIKAKFLMYIQTCVFWSFLFFS